MSDKIRVGVIFGGRSCEHTVSLMSAASILNAINKDKYEIVPVGITREGKWLIVKDPKALPMQQVTEETGIPVGILADPEHQGMVQLGNQNEIVGSLTENIDVVFPVLHGTYGEDGTVQGLLELANLPYVGCGVLASALGMDKPMSKVVFRQHGIPVVNDRVVLRSRWEQDPAGVLREIERDFTFPVFVKPANAGSSVGVSKVRNREELIAAFDLAARYERKIVVEQGVNAREIEVSVLGNDEPIVSVPGEIIPGHEFYDYEAKYIDDSSRLIIPADLPPEKAEEIRDLARRAFLALDCAGMARVDFFLDKDTGKVYVNEINTIPGFTKISMYPKLWEATGILYGELIDRLIELAFERHRDKNRNRVVY